MTMRLSSYTKDVLAALTIEPLWKRRGDFIRSSEVQAPGATAFNGMTIALLHQHRLVSVRVRRNPRRIEANLTAAGRRRAAAILAARAEILMMGAAYV